MKKYIIILNLALFISFFSHMNAQVAIGKTSVNGSGILDFGTSVSTIRTIVMNPINLPTCNATVKGAIASNAATGQLATCNGTAWTNNGSTSSSVTVSGTDAGNGVILGNPATTASGALILESTDKALILPKYAYPDLQVKIPTRGALVYDTTRKAVVYYNGTAWQIF
ncbi:hypothetical protein [Chryseobacterium shigense]|uniref:Uncharacterized protein n=1 Tax=Chryseobacterium shigense TaxID=297244 RepID=A0A841NDA4_9FLAO|nr:hypothetical protein [Chryseobacterium shigense]MBB6371310.1 hypothetical protein [Chryseobacterium shigense]